MFKRAFLLGALTGAAAIAVKVMRDRAYLIGYSDGVIDGFDAAENDDPIPFNDKDGYADTEWEDDDYHEPMTTSYVSNITDTHSKMAKALPTINNKDLDDILAGKFPNPEDF